MGAWGINAFENDAAADWLAELPASGLAAHVEDALQAALPSPLALMQRLAGKPVETFLDADVACIALTAAELVAGWDGRPHPELDDDLKSLLAAHGGACSRDLVDLARMAVQRIREDSELRDLWEESDDFAEWTQELKALEARLMGE